MNICFYLISNILRAPGIGSIPMETQIALNQLMREDYEGLATAAYPLVARPSLRERLWANLSGRTKLYVDSTHFSKPTEIYLFHCGRHRLWQMDYIHGNGSLNCVRCMKLSDDSTKTLNHMISDDVVGC